MPGRDVAIALRRMIDSPWACHSLLAGDDYVFAGLHLSAKERELLVAGIDGSLEEIKDELSKACMDPTLTNDDNAGTFFAAAQYALRSMERDVGDFRNFLGDRA